MPSSRGCRSSYDCIVKIKGVTTRPILFSQLMRSDGEGAMNPEELFADDRSPVSEQERIHEDELRSLMRSILDCAISFLSESSQGMVPAVWVCGFAGAMGRGAERAPQAVRRLALRFHPSVWWRGECGHSWQLSVRTRAFNDAGCPYCGRRLTLEGFNSAGCLDAGILHLWHPTENGDLKPSQVSDRTAKRIWLQCPTCGCEWRESLRGGSQREPQVPVVPWGKGTLSRQGQQ